jgi:hypothetical protein
LILVPLRSNPPKNHTNVCLSKSFSLVDPELEDAPHDIVDPNCRYPNICCCEHLHRRRQQRRVAIIGRCRPRKKLLAKSKGRLRGSTTGQAKQASTDFLYQ